MIDVTEDLHNGAITCIHRVQQKPAHEHTISRVHAFTCLWPTVSPTFGRDACKGLQFASDRLVSQVNLEQVQSRISPHHRPNLASMIFVKLQPFFRVGGIWKEWTSIYPSLHKIGSGGPFLHRIEPVGAVRHNDRCVRIIASNPVQSL